MEIKKLSPFDFINSFNNKSEYLFSEDQKYESWTINKGLSFTMDTILFANEMNRYSDLESVMQHDFYYYGIPKARRYGKWIKQEKVDDIELLSKFYGINKTIAEAYLKLLDEKQIITIRDKMNIGGKHGKSRGVN